jgi:hypothetical protein
MKKQHGVIYQREIKKIITNPVKETTREVAKENVPITNNNIGNKASRELDSLAKGSSRIILDIKSVFPFNFFPDEIIVDDSKVNIHIRYFFYSKEVRSVEFKDIFNIILQQGLFFAKLEIVDRLFTVQPLIITYLWKKDAIKARRIIQGMIIAKKQNIETQSLPIADLVRKLEKIGQSK